MFSIQGSGTILLAATCDVCSIWRKIKPGNVEAMILLPKLPAVRDLQDGQFPCLGTVLVPGGGGTVPVPGGGGATGLDPDGG